MPLFGRRIFHFDKDDVADEEDKETHAIEHTGQRIRNTQLYEKLKIAYELERWSCECTWRAALTHKEAYKSEIETRQSLPSLVPTYFNKPILEIVHHNVKPLEKLAEEVSILLGQGFVIGEPVQFKKKKDTTVVKGTVERIDDNDEQRKRMSERASVQARPPSDKQMKNVKYTIRLSDEDRAISNVQPNELQRCSLLPNREKLKTFIRSYAIRLGNRSDSPWVFYENSNMEKYQIKERLSPVAIEKFQKSMTITLDEILREQERILRKQAEEQAALLGETTSVNGHSHDDHIFLSDDDDHVNIDTVKKKKVKSSSTPATPKKKTPQNSPVKARPSSKTKSPSKIKKQLTLHDMKFTKTGGNSASQLLQKSSSTSSTPITTCNIAVPYALLQKLDKTRRDRGVQSKLFQRLVLHCARTLNEKQRARLPDEYRSLIQVKYDELELKRRLSEMSEQDRKVYLQSKQKEKQQQQKPGEDLDLPFLKILPTPIPIDSPSSEYVGQLLVVCTFFTSCHSLFLSSLTDDLSKTTQQFLRVFKHEQLLNAYRTSSSLAFYHYFNEFLLILMKLLFKEDENRLANEENVNDEEDNKQLQQQQQQQQINHQPIENHGEPMEIDDDIEQAYSIQLTDIPLTPYTCQELTRLYLFKEKNDQYQTILDKLAKLETKDFSICEQIDLLVLLVNIITTDNDLMADYFEYLTRTMSESYRERNQLMAERRKVMEEESKQKKLQLQNGENGKTSAKKQLKTGPLITPKNSTGTTNDENQQQLPAMLGPQSSPVVGDDVGDIDSGGDDDLKSVIQRRRQMVAMSKELKEKREIEAQKLYIEQKRDLAIQRADQAYQEALLNVQYGFRIKPLGCDRHYSRYWFFKGYAGLFVERGWIGEEINYTTQSSSSSQTQSLSSSQDLLAPRLSPMVNGEKLLPKNEPNRWWTYEDEASIEQLIQSLNERGIREHDLLVNLKKAMPLVHAEFEQNKILNKTKPTNEFEDIDANDQQSIDIISAFKSELEEMENRLRMGSLGGFIVTDNLNEWHSKLKVPSSLMSRQDLAELLIQLQQTVADKFASGIFGTRERHMKNATNSTKNSNRKKSSTKISPTILTTIQQQQGLQMWMNDCRTCKTYSRLHVLMMIFENAIAWDKSTLGIKCKVCRRKNKDEHILLCDQCCQGYHAECLRGFSTNPKLFSSSINELWYCPACRPQPTSKRRTRPQRDVKKIDYYDADIYDMDVDGTSNTSSHDRAANGVDENDHDEHLSNLSHNESDNDDNDDDDEDQNERMQAENGTHDDEINDENVCSVCGVESTDDNDLIECTQCRTSFHCQCHEPPLRCPPRSTTWMCNGCRTGANNELVRQPTSANSRRVRTRGQVATKKREKQRPSRTSQRQSETRRSARKNYRETDDDEEEEEEEEDEESDYERETRGQRRSKRLRQASASPPEDIPHFKQRIRRRVRIEKSTSESEGPTIPPNKEESDTEKEEEEEEEENVTAVASSPSSS